MALLVNIELVLDSIISGVDAERIGPAQFSLSAGDALKRVKTLPADEFHTLETGEMVGPFRFFLVNIHATASLKIGFGQAEPMTLAPGEFSFWNGPDIPFASGDGAESRLLYWIMNQS